MEPAPELNPEFITDDNGHTKAVILPIEEYEELLADLDDLAVIAERREEPTIPHESVVKELKENGYLPDSRKKFSTYGSCKKSISILFLS